MTLRDCIEKIRNDSDSISAFNEAQAKQSIIEPILESVNWNTRDYNEVKLEYGVETLWVDYALQINGENKVFIEAKRPSEKLETHQKQLLDYSFGEGVALAILTNGIAWWFYLPLKEGAWNNRKFYTIDILKQETEDIVEKFGLLLSREHITSGKAVQHAESILKSRQREERVKQALPEAWNSVIKEPHELLVEILIETVEEACDFKLENSEILRFMRSHQEKWLLPPTVMEPEPSVISDSPPSDPGGQGKKERGRKGNENVKDYLIPVIQLMRSGNNHKEAFKSVANELQVEYNTVSSQCTRMLMLSTEAFKKQVESNQIVQTIKDKYPDKHELIEWKLG